jgi:hypothetical protein
VAVANDRSSSGRSKDSSSTSQPTSNQQQHQGPTLAPAAAPAPVYSLRIRVRTHRDLYPISNIPILQPPAKWLYYPIRLFMSLFEFYLRAGPFRPSPPSSQPHGTSAEGARTQLEHGAWEPQADRSSPATTHSKSTMKTDL